MLLCGKLQSLAGLPWWPSKRRTKPLATVSLFCFIPRPKTLIKTKAQMHTACTQPNNHHVQHLPIMLIHFQNYLSTQSYTYIISLNSTPFHPILLKFLKTYTISVVPIFQGSLDIFRNSNQALSLPKIITGRFLDSSLARKHSFNSSFHAPKILRSSRNFTTPFPILFRPCNTKISKKIFLLPSFPNLFPIRAQ